MRETLWITIPINDKNALKNVISLIASKNLPSLSIDQLVKKLEKNQAADWIDVLEEYNKIPSLLGNTSPAEMLGRSRSVRDKFAERGFPDLQVRQLEPRELLSLVILCYSNPTLIGRNLCTALNDNNNDDVKKEMIQFSAKDRRRNRVIPSQSNLRLLSTGLYFNDTDIRLPQSVIDRVTRETIRDGLIVTKWDERGGFTEVIDGPARARNAGVQEITHRKRDLSEIDSHAVLQSLQSGESSQESFVPPNIGDASSSASPISYGNQSELTPQVLSLNATNAANTNNLHGNVLLGAWFFSCVAKPAYDYVGSFFSKAEHIEQPEKEAALLPPTAKP